MTIQADHGVSNTAMNYVLNSTRKGQTVKDVRGNIQNLSLIQASEFFNEAINAFTTDNPFRRSIINLKDSMKMAFDAPKGNMLSVPHGDAWRLIAITVNDMVSILANNNATQEQKILAIALFEKRRKLYLMGSSEEIGEAVSNHATLCLAVTAIGFGLGLYACRKTFEACIHGLLSSPLKISVATVAGTLFTRAVCTTVNNFFKPSDVALAATVVKQQAENSISLGVGVA